MHEILLHLRASQYVLDLGCGTGSFNRRNYPFTTIRVDLSRDGNVSVQAKAAQLPFKDRLFEGVYRSFCNFPLRGNFSGYRGLG